MAKQLTARSNRKLKKDLTKKVSSLVGKLILLFFIIVVVLWLGLQAFNFCVFHAIRTADAQIGELTASTRARGALLLQEDVVRAPESGNLEPLVSEGTRVSSGVVVAHMKPLTGPDSSGGSIEIRSPATGIVSYNLDGWEGVYERASWENSDPVALFQNLTKGNKPDGKYRQTEGFSKGDPVFKIVDNLINPCLIIKFAQGYSPQEKTGQRLQLTWGKEGNAKGRVLSLVNKEKIWYALVELEQVCPFPCQRLLELEVLSPRGEGVIIPDSALIKENNSDGVYIMTVLGPVFKKVEVIAAFNRQVAVRGISPGDEVVKNPGLAKLIKKDI